jgi:hypothetical protein
MPVFEMPRPLTDRPTPPRALGRHRSTPRTLGPLPKPLRKRITLPDILVALLEMKEEVAIDPAIAANARRSIERMIYLKS